MFDKLKHKGKATPKPLTPDMPPPTEAPKLREIVISTDGTMVRIDKAEVAGDIELVGVLQSVINFIREKQRQASAQTPPPQPPPSK